MKRITMTLMSLFAAAQLAVLAGSLGEGLNCSTLQWTTGGTQSVAGENVNWSYNEDDSYSDGACVVSGAGGAGEATSWLKTTVMGPCKISFRYRFQSYGGDFTVTDNATNLISRLNQYTSRNESWTYVEFELGSGSHEITFQYRHPGMGFVGAYNGVHLDEFAVDYHVSLATAVDADDMTFTTGGNADWFPQTSVTHDGEDAVRSGVISDSQTTWMQTTVTGPKQIRFWWKTSSEANYDILRFYVDDTEKASVSGTTDWSQQTVQVTGSGTHTLKWQYSKDGSVNSGDDCGWVDQVVITDAPSGDAQTYYVNGATGNDSNTGLSATAAKKTIQAAIDGAADGSTILVASGTYDPIESDNRTLTIKSISGRDSTIISGGCRTRCAVLGSQKGDYATVVEGFTISSGRTSASPGAGVQYGTLKDCYIFGCTNTFGIWNSYGGGAVYSHAIDCVFENNWSTHGAGLDGGIADRCVFRGNHAEDDGGAVSGSLVRDSLMVHNESSNWGGRESGAACAHGSTNINCTIVGNYARGGGGIVAAGCTLINCVLSENQGILIYDPDCSTLIDCFTSDNPMFVDAANGDYHLVINSPCVNAGNNMYVTSETDLDGNRRIVNGNVDVGCFEYGSEPWVAQIYVDSVNGSDLNSGTSWSMAKETIQAAIDVAERGDKIVVADGTYGIFSSSNKCICIESVNGAESTFVDGGGNYVRGNQLKLTGGTGWNTNTVLKGFTIQRLANTDGGTLVRCIVRDNNCSSVGGGALNQAVAYSCLFLNNVGMNGAAGDGTIFKNCTMVGNRATSGYQGVTLNSVLENCIVYNNGNNDRQTWSYWFNQSNLANWDHRDFNTFVGNPGFVDAANGNYRLSANSPCIDAGDICYGVGYCDLAGNSRIANKTVDIGCYEYGASPSITDGLVAWYKFDGNANDSSGNGNDGVVIGAMLTSDRHGRINSAYYFDGDDDYIRVPCSKELDDVRTNMTLAAWIRPDEWSDETRYEIAPLFSKGTDSNRQWGFSIWSNSTYELSDPILVQSSRQVELGEWQHVAITYDGKVACAYLNGVEVGRVETKIAIDYNDALGSDLLLGVDPQSWTKEFLKGALDDMRIYNYALSAIEVSAIYNEGGDPIVYRTVTFDANGGTCATDSVKVSDRATVGELPTVTRSNYDFLGWFTAAVGGEQVSSETVVTTDVTWYAHWQAIAYDIDYTGLRGASNSNPATYTIEDSVSFVNPGSVMGYRFAGWSPSRIAAGSTGNKSVTARWSPIAYTIIYANTKGVVNANPTSYTIEDAVTFAPLVDVDGWKFVGWSVSGIARGSTGNLTVTALWEEKRPDIGGGDDDDEPMDAGVANVYDGVIVDADGLPLGYINVKTAKASGKGDAKVSKVTATIQMAGEAKKVTVKTSVSVAEACLTQAAADGRVLDLSFSRYGMWGTFDGYEIDGVRNLLASKAKSDKGSEAKVWVESVLNELKGNYVMAYGDEYGWNGLSVSVMAKGKVKVSGKLANGTSVSTSTQLIVGDEYSVIPVFYTKGTTSLAFNIYYSHEDGEMMVFGYYDAVISPVTGIDSGLSFYIDGSIYDLFGGYTLLDEFLPDGLSVESSGSKLIVDGGAKAGKIVWNKSAGEVNEAKSKIDGYNVSVLKLTFKAKTGAFKGSFKVYAIDEKGSLKTFTATVSGVVVDGIGYGVATIKKIGSCAVVIAE